MARSSSRRRRHERASSDDAPTRRRRSSRNGKGGSFKVDFRDATGGGGRRYPEADYKVKIIKAERSQSQQGNAQIKVTYEFIEPEKYEGKTLVDFLTLTRKAAWRIGNLFDAVGIKWSQKVMEFKTSKLVGKELGITLADDTYNGRVKSKVADYLDLDTIEGILSGEDISGSESDVSESESESVSESEASESVSESEDEEPKKRSKSRSKARSKSKSKRQRKEESESESEDLDSFSDDDL